MKRKSLFKPGELNKLFKVIESKYEQLIAKRKPASVCWDKIGTVGKFPPSSGLPIASIRNKGRKPHC